VKLFTCDYGLKGLRDQVYKVMGSKVKVTETFSETMVINGGGIDEINVLGYIFMI